MELWKALLLFDEQTPKDTKPPTPYRPVRKVEPIVQKKEFSFFEDFNEQSKPEITARNADGKIPYHIVDPRNAPEPLNSFRHNDFVKLDRKYTNEYSDFNPPIKKYNDSNRNHYPQSNDKTTSDPRSYDNQPKTYGHVDPHGYDKGFTQPYEKLHPQYPESYGKETPMRAGSVAIPLSEYNEAVRAPWDDTDLALDLGSLRDRPTYSEPLPYRDRYKPHRKYSDVKSEGNRSVPILSREESMAASDISMPYSEPYYAGRGRKARHKQKQQPKKRRYVYVPSRDDAIIEVVEDSGRSDSVTPDNRPKRVHARSSTEYQRPKRAHAKSSTENHRRWRARSTPTMPREPPSSSTSESEYEEPKKVSRKRETRHKAEARRAKINERKKPSSQDRGRKVTKDRLNYKENSKPPRGRPNNTRRGSNVLRDRSDSRERSKYTRRGSNVLRDRSDSRERSNLRDKKVRKSRKPLESDRFMAYTIRDDVPPARKSSKPKYQGKRDPGRRGSDGFVNKDTTIKYAHDYIRDIRRQPRLNEHGDIPDEQHSVDSSSTDDDSYSESQSEPKSPSEGEEEDPGTTEGETGTTRKGGSKGRRFDDGPDGASAVYSENSKSKPLLLQGKRVAFFNFKEKSCPACIESVSNQRFPTFDSLLDVITDRLQIEKGANFIYHWPSIARIRKIDDFESEGTYIVSSSSVKKGAIEAVYGKLGPKQWHSGKVKHNDSTLIRKPPSGHDSPGSMSGAKTRPMVVTLVCNSTKQRNKAILNTSMHFEDLMRGAITDAVWLKQPPACALYSFKDGREVRSINQLKQYDSYDTFLVCGRELAPAMSLHPRGPPIRPRGRYIPDTVPPRPDLSDGAGDTTPRSNGVVNGHGDRQIVKIHGRRRGMPRQPPPPEHEFFPSNLDDGEYEPGKPSRKLMLDWVYGYRGSDRARNLDILDTAELIYYVASVVVIYDRQTHLQRFYNGHNEDITCLTVMPAQTRVATGQMQGRGPDHGAHIRIWDVDSLTTVSVIGLGIFQISIVAISFNDQGKKQENDNKTPKGKDEDNDDDELTDQPNSDLMMAVDGYRNTVSLWDLVSERIVGKTTTTTEAVTGGCFYPKDDDILITYGRNHLSFWRLDWDNSGRTQTAKILRDKFSGYAEKEEAKVKEDVPTHFTAITFTSIGEVITGDSNGSIMVWSPDPQKIFTLNRSDSEMNLHQSAVTSLMPYGNGMMLSGGGSEIYKWDISNGFKNPQRYQIGIMGNIQTLVPSALYHEDGVIYVGTDRNCIFEGYLHHRFTPIVQGHSGESACLAVHPSEPSFISAGRGMVMKWSASHHQCLWKTKLEGEKCTSAAIDPRERMVALGTKSGKVIFLDYTDKSRGQEEHSLAIGSKKINAVAFSPDGRRIAMAVDDGYIHLCSVERGNIGRDHGTSNIQRMSMTHIDWSLDSAFLQTSSSDFNVCFWAAEKKPRLLPNQKMRDADWATHKSLISGSILGPWQHLDTGETIKSVDRSNYTQKEMLVTGDSTGRIRLYKYPCPSPDSDSREVKAYSGAVNSLVFSGDDVFVFSTASSVANGELKTHLGIMQWAVVDQDVQVLPGHRYPPPPRRLPYHPRHYQHPHPHWDHPYYDHWDYDAPYWEHPQWDHPNNYYPPDHPFYKRFQ